MPTLRQTGGLSGFTKRSESEYDCFGAGHSSTTISAGLGNLFLQVKLRIEFGIVRIFTLTEKDLNV